MARELQRLLEVLEGPLGRGVDGAVESALAGLLELLRELASADADGRTRRAWTSAQNSFEGNAAIVVLGLIRRLCDASPNVELLGLALSALQGLLLLHRRSARLFERSSNLRLLLDLLSLETPAVASPLSSRSNERSRQGSTGGADVSQLGSPSLSLSALDTILAALADRPRNIRAFEDIGGLAEVVKLLRAKHASKAVRVKCLEVLYFYLQPEAGPTPGLMSAPATPRSASGPSRRHSVAGTPSAPSPTNPFLPPVTPARSSPAPVPESSVPAPAHSSASLHALLERADGAWAPSTPRRPRHRPSLSADSARPALPSLASSASLADMTDGSSSAGTTPPPSPRKARHVRQSSVDISAAPPPARHALARSTAGGASRPRPRSLALSSSTAQAFYGLSPSGTPTPGSPLKPRRFMAPSGSSRTLADSRSSSMASIASDGGPATPRAALSPATPRSSASTPPLTPDIPIAGRAVRSVEEKRALLSRHLGGVDALVAQFETHAVVAPV